MRIAVIGAGGVGGFYGGRLAHAGYDVSFVARGAHLAAMRDHGLTIENEPQGNIHVPAVSATDDPATIGAVDVVLIAVKLWDTERAARAARPLVGPDTAVVSLQNGVTKDDVLRGIVPQSAVIGGVVYVATSIARPGVIRQIGTMQRCVVGEYDGRETARAVRLVDAMRRAGIQADVSSDIRRSIWEKYVFLVGLSGATATMRSALGPIRANPQSSAFLLDLMQETVAVGRALGVDLTADYADQRMAFARSLPADMTSSMHHDLERGNRLEVDWLSGEVVKLGGQLGIPTPTNRAVRDILALHAGGRTT